MKTLRAGRVMVIGLFVILVCLLPMWAVAFDRDTVSNLVLWVDANDLDADGSPEGMSESGLTGTRIDTWRDKSSQGNHAIRQFDGNNPTYVTNAWNGKAVMRGTSGTANKGDYLQFTRITTIRTVFWVIKEQSVLSDGHFLLGDSGSYHFHRKSANGPFWDATFAHANIRNGTTRTNGFTVAAPTNTSIPANTGLLITLKTTGNVEANQITQDRTSHGSWQGDIAEILIFSHALSSNEESTVGAYLADKYGLTTAYAAPVLLPTVDNAVGATNVTLESAYLTGTLTSTGTAETAVFVFWGETDGGTNWGDWAQTNLWAAPQSNRAYSHAVTLSSNRSYHYRFAATNAVAATWASPSATLMTAPVTLTCDADASEVGLVAGTFTVHRASTATNAALTVNYAIAGGASNGVDYAALNGTVVIAVGAESASIPVTPLFDKLALEGTETVTLSLTAGPYLIGAASNATLNLADNPAVGCCYVWTNSPSETAPYNSWDTAAHDIQKAVDYAATNLALYDTVAVTNGNYGVTNTLNVTNGVLLRSVNGWASTTIYLSNTGALNRVLYVSHTSAIVDGFAITNGYATEKQGAGVYLNSGTLRNCLITKNYIPRKVTVNHQQGAGLYQNGGLVENCVISNNEMSHEQASAGGAYVNNGTMRACRIVDNRLRGSSSEYGAGLYVNNSALVENCLIAGNVGLGGSSGQGCGAVYLNNGTLRNCTVVGNTITNQTTAGIYRNGGTVTNCIVFGNQSIRGDYISWQVNTTNGFAYSCATELTNGAGNITADPDFMDAAGGNYRLAAGSPCRNTGTNYSTLAASDLDGNPRLVQGCVDMGAYEKDTTVGAMECDFTASAAAAFDFASVVFTPSLSGASANTNVTGCGWDFGDGQRTTTPALTAVTNAYGLGSWSVTLTVTNDLGYTTNRVKMAYVRIYSSTNYVWSGGASVAPYASWANAATSVAGAVSAAGVVNGQGGVVLVTNGGYGVASELIISKAITLKSVNGPAVTAIYRGVTNVQYRVLRMANSGATLAGLSITNGYAQELQGNGVYAYYGLITNCHMRFNRVPSKGSVNNLQGIGLYLNGATVADCLVADNELWNEGTSGAGAYVNAGLMRNTVIRNNVMRGSSYERGCGLYVNGGAVENCLIVSNVTMGGKTEDPAGAVYMNGGTLRNCTVSANVTTNHQFAGIYLVGGTVVNSISSGNLGLRTGYLSSEVNTTSGFTYSCAPELISGLENESLPAQLRPNFTLDSVSPCIDAGTNGVWTVGTDDLARQPRVINGQADMGCYEYDATAGDFACSFGAVPTEAFDTIYPVFTASASGANTNLVYYWWDFGDGQTREGPGLGYVSNLYTIASNFTVRLAVSNTMGQVTAITNAAYIRVYPSTNYVSITGGHVPPFVSWANAATTVQAAVDAAWWNGSQGTLVRVADGAYPLTNTLFLSSGITLRSENGPMSTVLYRSVTNLQYRVVRIANAQAVVSGFTITNGFAQELKGNGVYLENGLLTNCVIRLNNCLSKGILNNLQGVGLYMEGGVAANCTISENTLLHEQSRGAGAYVAGGILRRSIIRDNRIWGSTWEQGSGLYMNGSSALAENCLVVGNVALGGVASEDGAGLSLANGTIRNCTVAANVATNHQVAGLYRSGGGVTNTVVYGNLGIRAGYASSNVNTTVGFAYSCAPELTAGVSGNITNNPRFNDEAVGDYTLQGSSPCLNTGTNETWMTNAVDLVGRRRLFGGIVDMGAYENPNNPGSIFTMR